MPLAVNTEVWSAIVAFDAPSVDGGAPITEYIVTSIPAGITAYGTSSPIIVTGIDDGTAYAFTVKAVNVVGEGADSIPSNATFAKTDYLSVSPLELIDGALVSNTYYTTVLYPIQVVDSLSISSVAVLGGFAIDAIVDEMAIAPISIQSGSLVTTIAYQEYNNWEADTFAIAPISIQSGSLV